MAVDFEEGGPTWSAPPTDRVTLCGFTAEREPRARRRSTTRRSARDLGRRRAPRRGRGRAVRRTQGAGARRRRHVVAAARGAGPVDRAPRSSSCWAPRPSEARRCCRCRSSRVRADDWAEGMGASLRAGLAALAATGATTRRSSRWSTCPTSTPTSWPGCAAAATGRGDLARAAYDGGAGAPGPDRSRPLGGRHRDRDRATGARADYLAAHEVELVECGDLATGVDVDHAADPPPALAHPGRPNVRPTCRVVA